MSDATRLQAQLDFLLEIDKLKSILRQNHLADGSRQENSAEHSWHLAMYVLVLAEHFPGVDVLRAVKMAMLHDLVEIYAGDTFAYDPDALVGKADREHDAARRLFGMLPADQMAEMMRLWLEFEAASSPEAICAAVADRLQPLALNLATEGRMWRSRGVTAEQVLERNRVSLESGPAAIAEHVRATVDAARLKGHFAPSAANEVGAGKAGGPA